MGEVFAGCGSVCAASAVQDKEANSKKADAITAQKKDEFDAHAPTVRYHFKDTDMDWTFGFMLGTTSNHGFEIGEAYYAASRIKAAAVAASGEAAVAMSAGAGASPTVRAAPEAIGAGSHFSRAA